MAAVRRKATKAIVRAEIDLLWQHMEMYRCRHTLAATDGHHDLQEGKSMTSDEADKALLDAVERQDIDEVKQLIASSDVSAEGLIAALTKAELLGSNEIAQVLRAEVDRRLITAAENENDAAVGMLTQYASLAASSKAKAILGQVKKILAESDHKNADDGTPPTSSTPKPR